jgi:hypothetical protein
LICVSSWLVLFSCEIFCLAWASNLTSDGILHLIWLVATTSTCCADIEEVHSETTSEEVHSETTSEEVHSETTAEGVLGGARMRLMQSEQKKRRPTPSIIHVTAPRCGHNAQITSSLFLVPIPTPPSHHNRPAIVRKHSPTYIDTYIYYIHIHTGWNTVYI